MIPMMTNVIIVGIIMVMLNLTVVIVQTSLDEDGLEFVTK